MAVLVLFAFVTRVVMVVRTMLVRAMLMTMLVRIHHVPIRRVVMRVLVLVAMHVLMRMGMHSYARVLMGVLMLMGVLVLMVVAVFVVALHGCAPFLIGCNTLSSPTVDICTAPHAEKPARKFPLCVV
jgi:hypothetical protein